MFTAQGIARGEDWKEKVSLREWKREKGSLEKVLRQVSFSFHLSLFLDDVLFFLFQFNIFLVFQIQKADKLVS